MTSDEEESASSRVGRRGALKLLGGGALTASTARVGYEVTGYGTVSGTNVIEQTLAPFAREPLQPYPFALTLANCRLGFDGETLTLTGTGERRRRSARATPSRRGRRPSARPTASRTPVANSPPTSPPSGRVTWRSSSRGTRRSSTDSTTPGRGRSPRRRSAGTAIASRPRRPFGRSPVSTRATPRRS